MWRHMTTYRLSLVARVWWHQASNQTNVDLRLFRFCGILMRAISQRVPRTQTHIYDFFCMIKTKTPCWKSHDQCHFALMRFEYLKELNFGCLNSLETVMHNPLHTIQVVRKSPWGIDRLSNGAAIDFQIHKQYPKQWNYIEMIENNAI